MEMGVCRHNDLIRTRAGKRFHPAYFNRLLYGLRQIDSYQWVQTDIDRIVLNLVAAERLSAENLASIERHIRADVDEQMRLQVIYLDDLPRTGSGKHRFVIGLANDRAG
jgi:phenylacetate-CoA ligase